MLDIQDDHFSCKVGINICNLFQLLLIQGFFKYHSVRDLKASIHEGNYHFLEIVLRNVYFYFHAWYDDDSST